MNERDTILARYSTSIQPRLADLRSGLGWLRSGALGPMSEDQAAALHTLGAEMERLAVDLESLAGVVGTMTVTAVAQSEPCSAEPRPPTASRWRRVLRGLTRRRASDAEGRGPYCMAGAIG